MQSPANPNKEEQNAEFQFRIRELENQVDELQNLYISSSQLIRAVVPSEVIEAVREILLNLVGAEGFDVSLRESGNQFTTLISGERPGPTRASEITFWDEQRAYVMSTGQTLFNAAPELVVVIPLMVGDSAVGVLSIFQLLNQKAEGLSARDLQVLEFLATHAATALVCAALYQRHTTAVADYLNDLKKV